MDKAKTFKCNNINNNMNNEIKDKLDEIYNHQKAKTNCRAFKCFLSFFISL